MQTVTVEAEVDADGVLRLTVPVGLPAGKVEVVLVIQPCAEGKKPRETGYEWLLDPQYENIGRAILNPEQPQDNFSQKERAKRIMELLDIALEGVTWDEIEESRRDR
jgi:hypothetical protein